MKGVVHSCQDLESEFQTVEFSSNFTLASVSSSAKDYDRFFDNPTTFCFLLRALSCAYFPLELQPEVEKIGTLAVSQDVRVEMQGKVNVEFC